MRVLALLLSCFTPACTSAQFSPETMVKDLRVLSISVEPPEVAPGETATLSLLKSDPPAPGVTTVLWVGCEPDPLDLGRSPCNDASLLLRPTQITDYPEGLQLLGFGLTANYRSKSTVFSSLPADSPIRRSGSVGQVLALVIGEDVDPLATGDKLRAYFERIERKETPVVVALTRVLVSEKAPAERNQNPAIIDLFVGGQKHALGARLAVKPGAHTELSASVPIEAQQAFVEAQPSGNVTKTETVVGAWYSTAGRFSRERFDATSAQTTTFIAPGSKEFPEDPVPERKSGVVWLVIRDSRGGQSFARYPFSVCDESLPSPQVVSIRPATSPGGQVVVEGQNMDAVLDVIVGDAALGRATYSPTSQAFLGDAPTLLAGRHSVRVRGKNCTDADTGLIYEVK